MSNYNYLFYYTLIFFILLLFQYLNKHLYYMFGFLLYTYAVTNLFLKKCSLDSYV